MYGVLHKFINVIQALEENDVDIKIVAYVRRHDAWIRSAYVQWGIRHKTYNGRIKSFNEWINEHNPNHSPTFYEAIKPFIEKNSDYLCLRNMDAANCVVKDFMQTCGIEINGISSIRIHESPSNEELLLRALFNSLYKQKIVPSVFDKMVSYNEFSSPQTYMDYLMPSSGDLIDIINSPAVQDDIKYLNLLLAKQDQPPIVQTNLKEKSYVVDNDKLIITLCQNLLQLMQKVQGLEMMVKESKMEKEKPAKFLRYFFKKLRARIKCKLRGIPKLPRYARFLFPFV